MSNMIYIQDDFGTQIPLLDNHGNLTVQVLMLYSEDKLTEADRKTVNDFVATDEMAKDALEGFALTANASKTRYHLGQLNNALQKKTGAATTTSFPKQQSDFDYRKLAAAIAVLVVIGGVTFLGAQYFGKDELADNAAVEKVKLEPEVPVRETIRENEAEEDTEVAEDQSAVVDLLQKTEEPKEILSNSDSRTVEPEPEQKEQPKTEPLKTDKTTNEQFAKAKDKNLQDNDTKVAGTAAPKKVTEEITVTGAINPTTELAKKTENYGQARSDEAEKQRLQQTVEATMAKADRALEALDRESNRAAVRQMESEVAHEAASLAEEKADLSKVAKYPGGDIAMYKFIERKKIYTDAMRALNLKGAVTIGFDIEPDGRISNATVKAGENGLMNEDALRVVRSMPKWNPARDASGNAIRSSKSVVIKYGE